MGTHLKVLSKNYLMNYNMTGFNCFQKSLQTCALDEGSLSIGTVKHQAFQTMLSRENHSHHVNNLYKTLLGAVCVLNVRNVRMKVASALEVLNVYELSKYLIPCLPFELC